MADPQLTEKIEIFMVYSKVIPPVLTQIQKHYLSSPDYPISQKTIPELKIEADANKKCIIIFTIIDSESVNEFMTFAQSIRNQIRVKRIIPMALLKSSNQKIESLLTKTGCLEVLTFTASYKSLVHKMNRHLKLLELNKKEVEDQFDTIDRKGPEAAPKPTAPQVVFSDPIEAAHDFWLLVKKSHAKKYVKNWLIEMVGPSPAAGSWKKNLSMRGIFPGKDDLWEWVASDPKSYFHTPTGSWVFVGNQPEYNWSINRWGFVGSSAELSFVEDGKVRHFRFKAISPMKLEINNNSAYATGAGDKIKDTYDRTHSFSQEKTEIPWGEEELGDIDPNQWNQGDLSKDEDTEYGFLKSLLDAPGYKIRGTLNQYDIELLGFGDEPNNIFIGFAEPVTTIEAEVVVLKLIVETGTRPVVHEMRAKVEKVHEVEPTKFIAKVVVLQEWVEKLDKVKRSFFDRGKIATSFIQKAKGIESNADTSIKGEDAIQNFLQNNHIIILDSVSSARVSLASSLVKIGAIRKKMSLVGTIEAAQDEAVKHNARIIFSDYMIGSKSGLGFIQDFKMELEKKGIRQCVAILVTSNASQSAVARAAEGDIDNFIVKPYPFENLRKIVVQTIHDKLNPNEYIQLVDQGKDFLLIDETQSAMDAFKKATEKDPHPALALCYLGQLSMGMKNYADAEKYYIEALSHNEIHFGSLNGLHDLLFAQHRFDEAYKVARDLVKYFPAHPKRLSNVLRASIVTDNFKDIKEYYSVYLDMEERTEELIRYVCSAMVVGGKHFLRRKDKVNALPLFENAAVSSAGRTQYLYYIVETLVDHKLVQESQGFLKRLNTIAPASNDFQAAKFLVSTLTLPTIDVVYQGRELLKKGVEAPAVYEKLIIHSRIAGYGEAADDLVAIAIKKWPDKKDLFQPQVVLQG